MKFPTIDEFAKEVAEKALDEITYEGKTLREWAEIITKQQSCEDCISRADVLMHSHIEYDDDGVGHRVIYIEDIEDLPSVKPMQTRWIPCSEKNPNETGEYFTTIKWLDRENVYRYMVVKRDYFAEVDTWNDSLVIAWMPLPESYKEAKDE